MTDGEYADSLARALYRCTQLEIEISHLKRDNERLRAENARLREALNPFVPKTQVIDPAIPDTRPIDVMVRAGELRAAREALGNSNEKTGI